MNMIETIKKYALIVLGVSMVAFSVAVFYTPNKIVSGGASGISTILYYAFSINQGLTFFTINVVLLLISIRSLGWRFIIDTIWTSALLSLLVEVFSYIPPLTNDVFLATIFGSVLYGTGCGLTLINGASTGGNEILARLVQKKFPYVKIGTLLLILNICVIMSSLIVFKNVDLSFYGMITLFSSSFSINLLIKKLNISKLAFVITDKGDEIAEFLVSKSSRGVTLLESRGAFTKTNNNVLICALKEHETTLFQKRVLKLDPNAFIIFSESTQIVGNGFKVYK